MKYAATNLHNEGGKHIIGNDGYAVRIFHDFDSLDALKDQWNELAERSGAYLPWRCYDWYKLCESYNNYNKVKLCVYVISKGEKIIAILPTWHQKEKYKGLIEASVVRIVSTAQASLQSIIYDKEYDLESIVKVFFRTLKKENSSWDIVELDKLPVEGNFSADIAKYVNNNNLKYRSSLSCVNWYIDGIDYPSKSYLDTLSATLKKDIQYCKRRLEREGKLEFLLVSDPAEIQKYLDLYDSVRENSWKSAEKNKQFIRDFTVMTAREGWLRLGFLIYNGNPIAAQKWFICGDYAHIYDVLYAEDWKKYSPGKILSFLMFEHAIDTDKVTTIDYLQGDENYKKEWTNRLRERKCITIFNNTARGLLYYLVLTKIKPLFSNKQAILNNNFVDFVGK